MAEAKLAEIAVIGDQKTKTEEYRALLGTLVANKQIGDLCSFVEQLAAESTALVVSRVVLQEFATKIKEITGEEHIKLATFAIAKIQPRVVAFEDQISVIRENLSTEYEEVENYEEAAQALIGIPLESGQRVLSADYKVSKYVKIAWLYLEDFNYFDAEKYLQKSLPLLPDVKEKSLVIRHKGSMARILEYKRKFFDAGTRYYDLSFMLQDPDDAKRALEGAIICAVMAPAGPQRSRQLAQLYKDERSPSQPLYPILQKMFTDRIIRPTEVESFAKSLVDRPTANDSGALEQAIREHNLLSASKVYLNISFDELGVLLNISAFKAEQLASTMISESRLQGHIDQLARLIHFQATNSLQLWDSRIETTCSSVNAVVDRIALLHPQLVEDASKKHM